jgi:hypothetical protein
VPRAGGLHTTLDTIIADGSVSISICRWVSPQSRWACRDDLKPGETLHVWMLACRSALKLTKPNSQAKTSPNRHDATQCRGPGSYSNRHSGKHPDELERESSASVRPDVPTGTRMLVLGVAVLDQFRMVVGPALPNLDRQEMNLHGRTLTMHWPGLQWKYSNPSRMLTRALTQHGPFVPRHATPHF